MSDSNEMNISEILFDPKISEILELLENGPKDESKICEHLSITPKDIAERLEPLVKNGFVIKSGTQYSVDSEKLANAVESSVQYGGVMDKVTEMDSYLN